VKSRRRNQAGSIFTIVPSKILFFDAPSPSVPPDRSCIEIDGRRQFSASFYADMLHRLGVKVVVRLDGAACDSSPFGHRGIRLCDREALGMAGCSETDRVPPEALKAFVDLVEQAGGAVAVQCEGRAGQACTLAAAWMARVDIFPSPEVAAAWAAMARGVEAPAADLLALRCHWSRRRMALHSHSAPSLLSRAHHSASPDPPPRGTGQPAAATRRKCGDRTHAKASRRTSLSGHSPPLAPARSGALAPAPASSLRQAWPATLAPGPGRPPSPESAGTRLPPPPGDCRHEPGNQCRRVDSEPGRPGPARAPSTPPPPHDSEAIAPASGPEAAGRAGGGGPGRLWWLVGLAFLLALALLPPVPPAAAAGTLLVLGLALAGVLAWMALLLRPPPRPEAAVRQRRAPEWAL
jgi:hypothetical protein